MNIPANLRYTSEHEWIRVEGNEAFVGITDYAQSGKTVSDLNMPVSGTVLEFNEALNDQPELVNNDPYGEGWMIKVTVDNPAELDTLLDAASYEKLIG